MKKYLPFVIALVVLFGGYSLIKGMTAEKSQPAVMEDDGKTQSDLMMEQGQEGTSDAMMEDEEETESVTGGEVKSFILEARNFTYSQKEIRVREGDRVRITLASKQGFHDWVIDEFDAKTKQINEGSQDIVEFIADEKGTFEYYCSVGNHRQQGMGGKLIVE